MQTTYRELVEAFNMLDKLLDEDVSIDGSLTLARALRELEGPAQDYERTRGKLIEKHAARDGEDQPVRQPTSQTGFVMEPSYAPARDELLAKKVECDITKFALGRLGLERAKGRWAYKLWFFLEDDV